MNKLQWLLQVTLILWCLCYQLVSYYCSHHHILRLIVGTVHRPGIYHFGIQNKVLKIKNRFYKDKQGCSQTKWDVYDSLVGSNEIVFKLHTSHCILFILLAKLFWEHPWQRTIIFIVEIWKPHQLKINSLKLVSAIFYQIFISHQMIALQKQWNWLFYLKSSFCSWDLQIFVISSSTLFLTVRHCFRSWSKINQSLWLHHLSK